MIGVAPVVVLGLFLLVSPVRTFAFGGGGSTPERVRVERRRRGAAGARRAPDGVADGRPRRGSTRAPSRASPPWRGTRPGTATPRPRPTTRSSRCRRSSPAGGRARTLLQVASEHPDNLFTLLGGEPPPRRVRGAHRHLPDAVHPPGARAVRAGASAGSRRRRSTRSPPCPPSSATGCRRPSPPRARPRAPGSGPSSTATSGACSPPPRTSASRASSTRCTPRREPTLNYMHLVLPHRPWVYLPDGRAGAGRGRRTGSGAGRATPGRRPPPGGATCSRRATSTGCSPG